MTDPEMQLDTLEELLAVAHDCVEYAITALSLITLGELAANQHLAPIQEMLQDLADHSRKLELAQGSLGEAPDYIPDIEPEIAHPVSEPTPAAEVDGYKGVPTAGDYPDRAAYASNYDWQAACQLYTQRHLARFVMSSAKLPYLPRPIDYSSHAAYQSALDTYFADLTFSMPTLIGDLESDLPRLAMHAYTTFCKP